MQKEHQSAELTILNYIEQNSDATQRELSQEVGVSLGMINLLVKKLVRTGLIKIEGLQPNSIRYFLTPKGIANKIERTYGYVVRTYNQIHSVRSTIVAVADRIAEEKDADTLIFFGKEDEISAMIEDLIQTKAFKIDAVIIHDKETLLGLLRKEDDQDSPSALNQENTAELAVTRQGEEREDTSEELSRGQGSQQEEAYSSRSVPIIVWAEAAERELEEEHILYENMLRNLVI